MANPNLIDAEQISSLLGDDNFRDELLKNYTDSQWNFMTDVNNTYAAGTVPQFNTNNISKSQWIDYHTSYLTIPLSLVSTPGTNPYSASTQIAIKNSLLSLISRITVQDQNGQMIVSDNNINFINNERLLTDYTEKWLEQNGAEIMWGGIDSRQFLGQSFTGPVGESMRYGTGAGAAGNWLSPSNNVDEHYANYNPAYLNRVKMLQNYSSVASNTISFTAKIPLAMIHDFFKQLTFPVINQGFIIQPYISFLSDPSYPPFGRGYSLGVNTSVQSASIVTDPYTVTITSPIRWYYKTVKFPSSVLKTISERFSSGFKKKIQCKVSLTTFPHTNFSSNLADTVSQGIIRPVKLSVLLYPTGAITSTNPTGACNAPVGQLTNTQIQINNVNYYLNSFTYDQEYWREFKQCFPSSGENTYDGYPVTYQDWVTNQRYYVFDLSRVHDILKYSVNTPCIIYLTSSRQETNPAPMDVVYILERLIEVELSFSNNNTSVTVGVPSLTTS